MGYRDDFYKPENIVGYTGNIKNNPTVYFERKEKDGSITFGRITQQHDNKGNEGREIVRNSKDYKRENTYYNRLIGSDKNETYSLLTDDRKNEKVVKESADDFINQLLVTFEGGKSKYYSFSCVESYFGGIQHVSRTPFTDVEKSQMEELSKSITKFKEIKIDQKGYTSEDLFPELVKSESESISNIKNRKKLKTNEAKPDLSNVLSSDKFKEKEKKQKAAVPENGLDVLSSDKHKLANLAKTPKRGATNTTSIKVGSKQPKKKRENGNANNFKI